MAIVGPEERRRRFENVLKLIIEQGISKTEAFANSNIGHGQHKWLGDFPDLEEAIRNAVRDRKGTSAEPTEDDIDRIMFTYYKQVRVHLVKHHRLSPAGASEIASPNQRGGSHPRARFFLEAIEKNNVAFFQSFGLDTTTAEKIIATYQPVFSGEPTVRNLHKVKQFASDVADLLYKQRFPTKQPDLEDGLEI